MNELLGSALGLLLSVLARAILYTQGQLRQLLTAIKGLVLNDNELRARCSMFLQ